MSQTNEVNQLTTRYKDAYLVARGVVGVGDGLKALGIITAIIILIGAIAVSQAFKSSGDPGVLVIIGAAFALPLGAIIFAIGVLVSAQGQILRAALDSAVSVSPFLTNEIRSQIMFSTSKKAIAKTVSRTGGWTCRCGYVNTNRLKWLNCEQARM